MDHDNKRAVLRTRALSQRSILPAASRTSTGSRLRCRGLTVREYRPRVVFLPFEIRGRAGFLPALTAHGCFDQSREGR